MSGDDQVCETCWRATCPGTCTGPDPTDRLDLERRAAAIEAADRIARERQQEQEDS